MVAARLNRELAADSLEEEGRGAARWARGHLDRFLALPHTEGCGVGYSHGGEKIFNRIVTGCDARRASVSIQRACVR